MRHSEKVHRVLGNVPAGAGVIRNLLISLFCLAQGCATIVSFGVGAQSGGIAPPLAGTFLDLMLLGGGLPGPYGNFREETLLRVLAGFDLLPSFALDVTLLPITVPVHLIFY